MPLQPPPTTWQLILQILGLIIRIPVVILIIVTSCSLGYLGITIVIKATVWFYEQYLAKPW